MNETNTEVLTVDPPKAIAQANPFAERASQEEAKPRKASLLDLVTTRKRRRPVLAMLYGPPGVGKSTFGASAPNPIFIPCERGLDQITVPKFPTPKTLAEFGTYLNAVDTEEHDYQTVVIDTADALELLIFDAVCNEGKVKSIEEFGGGYGKGFTRAREYWARLLTRLTALSERMNVLLVAHSHLRTVSDPMLATAYDIHEPKIQAKSIELIRQSVDLIMFARIQTSVIKDGPKARKGRGLIGDDREMFTQPTTGIECKNRFNLESPMEFNWATLQTGIDAFYNK
jgi:AAA domain